MKATGALPTEERVQRMNDHQWLWYYMNINKDAEEEENKWKERLDYMGWWINPQLAESVMNIKSGKQPEHKKQEFNNIPSEEEQIKNAPYGQSTIMVQGDVVVSDSFEEELKRAMGGSDELLTQLPDSSSAGNAYESKEDFLSKVMMMQDFAFEQNNELLTEINGENHNDEYMEENDEYIEENSEEILDINNLPDGINPEDIDYFDV